MSFDARVNQINLLINRLELLSADSILSHRASGIRGSLLEYLEELNNLGFQANTDFIDHLIDQGYLILAKAARQSLLRNRFK